MTSKLNITLSGPDLAALLCSRVCHDVISPVGAINNGLELLDEGGTDDDALDLIRTSALNASVRLKFARLAFGASGSAGASIDTGEAEKAAQDFAAPKGSGHRIGSSSQSRTPCGVPPWLVQSAGTSTWQEPSAKQHACGQGSSGVQVVPSPW